MSAYLTRNPPRVSQFAARALSRITGCTVLHSTESVFDEIGADTGAEGVARYISTRTTYGSYHKIADSDSQLTVVPFHLSAYQDGTGSNPWAMSLAFACRTVDWARMSAAKRTAVLRQGALAWAEMEAWKRSRGLPPTQLRRITKKQSDAGWSGFIAHGDRDPGRRTDPGTRAPHLFPWDEWFDACRWALAGSGTQEDELDSKQMNELAELTVAKLRNADMSPLSGTQSFGDMFSQQWTNSRLLVAEVAGLRAAVLELAKGNVNGDDIVAKVKDAIRDAVVQVDVQVTGPQT